MNKGDQIKCKNTNEWLLERNRLEYFGYRLNFLPGMVIEIAGVPEGKGEKDVYRKEA